MKKALKYIYIYLFGVVVLFPLNTPFAQTCSVTGQCKLCDIQAQITSSTGVTVNTGTATLAGPVAAGSAVSTSALEVTATDCGEISLVVDLSFEWYMGVSTSWIHGVSFQNSAGWTAATGSPPGDPGWLFMPMGLTGLCSGTMYGPGYYYDPPGSACVINSGDPYDFGNYSSWDGMMCAMSGSAQSSEDPTCLIPPIAGVPVDGDPSDNWGVGCGWQTNGLQPVGPCDPLSFNLTYCPSSAGTQTESITFRITEDGESGGWASNAGCNYDITIPITINNAGIALLPTYTVNCGECVDLEAGSNCTSYTWFNDDTGVQIASGNNLSTINVCPTETTNYSVNVTGDCGALSATTQVIVNPCPCTSEAGTINNPK